MACEGFGMVGASAAIPGGVGWVFIATPHKLVIAVQKLAIMTCTSAALLRQPVALPWCSTAAKIHDTAAALKNSTGHLTENAITFYSEFRFK